MLHDLKSAPRDARFVPPMPPLPLRAPSGFALLKALRTNSLGLWPAEAYEADVFVSHFLGRKMFLVNAPEAIRHVLMEGEGDYGRSPMRERILRPATGQGLLLSANDEWKVQRRTAAPAFTPRAAPILAPHFAAIAKEGIDLLATAPGLPVDIFETIRQWSIEMTGRSMFSIEMRDHRIEMNRLIATYVPRLAQPYFLDVVLPVSIRSPHDFMRRRFNKAWMDLLGEMVDERMRAPAGDTATDLFDLLRAARDPETNEGFTAQQLRDQIATMVVAGHETSTVAMFWAIYLLASDAATQATVAAEVADLDLSPAAITETLPHLVHTRAVLSEAMRLYPPAFMIVRQATRDMEWEGTAIPNGSTVLVAPWVLHRSRKYWTNPEAFDPSRFLPGAPPPPRTAYLPFGIGPRICIGAQMATTMMTVTVASLVKAFRINREGTEPVLPVCVATSRPDHQPRFRLEPRR